MSIGTTIPTPQIICVAVDPNNSPPGEDGHFAICPVCGVECNILVNEVAFLDETGTQRGFTSDYDLTSYVDHYTSTHPDG